MRLLVRLALPVVLSAPLCASGLLPPLTESQQQEAKRLLQSFKSHPRGPFLRIRWFCNDGTVHPPSPPPCVERGGGRQHAELSPAALTLAKWDLDAGTILAGMTFEQFFDAARDHYRLRELVLEKYLVDVDGGWIYRRANSYRGARQAEDEEKAGREFLIRLLSDPEWTRKHYFLANQLIGAIPHGLPDSTVKRIRTLATAIAEQQPGFQPIRSKIHSSPDDSDLQSVEKFLAVEANSPAVKAMLQALAKLMREDAGTSVIARLPALQAKVRGSPLEQPLQAFSAAFREQSDADRLQASAAALSMEIYKAVTSSKNGSLNLDLLDLNSLLQEIGFRSGSPVKNLSRRQLVARLTRHFQYCLGAGLLSQRQYDALAGEMAKLEGQEEVAADAWFSSVRYLARAAEWSRATVARDFGEVSERWADVEPAAGALVDHLTRASAALPLSNHLEQLISDANQVVGVRHSILGEESGGSGIVGLNPGIAAGNLGIVKSNKSAAGNLNPRGIYVIPETVSELKPVAGILSLDSGNLLSHTQLLAANLGIPNATIPSSLLPLFEKLQGKDVFFAVTPRGVVVLREKSSLTPEEQRALAERPAIQERVRLDSSRLNLSETRILDLSEVGLKDAGVIAGPKAANLGQLARYFPNEVAPGLVIPFGVYFEHINRILPGDTRPLSEQIAEAYSEANRLRAAGAPPEEVQRYIYPKLARFREAISSMPLLPEFEKELMRRMEQRFGQQGTYGVFVRSDTNAEDLPEFTGAGLNLTMPNQVGAKAILQALRNVWASPFSERAYDWRSRILEDGEHVYPSVILMRAVASDKSGVIATVNLETGNQDESTVNASEGVGAVVDGGVAESILLLPSGQVKLLQQARGRYKKVLKPSGGLQNLPVSGEDAVLTPKEIEQIRRLVASVKARYPAVKTAAGEVMPWDIEFGFEKGQLRLFQIRPLVRYRQIQTLELFTRLDQQAGSVKSVRLDAAPAF